MEWTDDVTAGDWLRERIDDPWRGTMHDVVPRGFAAYARVFHPADRDRPEGQPWPPLPYGRHRKEWDAFQSSNPGIRSERVSWATAAAAFGTTMHPLAQWDDLVERFREVEGEDGPRDAEGWRYGRPMWGQLPADLVAVIAELGAAHTATPADAYVGVWAGWGGLLGAMGHSPSRALLTFTDEPGDPHHEQFLERSVRDGFNNPFRKPTWQPGVLPDDVSRGARLELPAREHVLFRGTLTELADPEWARRMPWTDPERMAFPDPAESPSLIWPADRAWVFATDVDWDSTVVAGPTAFIQELCADPRLEALPLREGADLSSLGDELNR